MQEKEIRVLLVEDNPGDARLVREMLADAQSYAFRVHSAETLIGALDALGQNDFDVALVDLTLPDSQGLATFETIQRHAHSLPVVVFTGVTNEILALTAVERGAQDYLVKGRMTGAALVRVLQYSLARHKSLGQAGQKEPPRASVTGFLAAKGGVGTTTIASHFAIEWTRQAGGKGLLMDLDFSAASAEFLLKVKSDYSVLDAATNLHRLDTAFWNGIVCTTEHGIEVLQAPNAIALAEQLSSERVRHVLRFARTLYRQIVVDLGRLNAFSLNLLEEVGELFVVTTGDLPALYEASRVLKRLAALGMDVNRLRLVLNRVGKTSMVSAASVEKALGYPVHWTLQDYGQDLNDAHADGCFFDEGLGFRKQVAQFVAKSLGVEEKPAVRTFSRLLRLARA